jgi:hypothetical protein
MEESYDMTQVLYGSCVLDPRGSPVSHDPCIKQQMLCDGLMEEYYYMARVLCGSCVLDSGGNPVSS